VKLAEGTHTLPLDAARVWRQKTDELKPQAEAKDRAAIDWGCKIESPKPLTRNALAEYRQLATTCNSGENADAVRTENIVV
jgi:hypothetical protein